MKLSKESFVIYLKDGRLTFTITSKELLNHDKFNISRPDLVMPSKDKSIISWRIMREARRREDIKVKARKADALLAREKWVELQFKNMTENIKKYSYTIQDLKCFRKEVSLPFKRRSSDGCITVCNQN